MNSQDILEELEEMAPLLISLRRNDEYRLPDAYFESLTEDILVKNQGPFYSIPDDYFENLEGNIFDKIKDQKTKFPIRRILSLVVGVAASVLLFFVLMPKEPTIEETDTDEYSIEEEYFESILEESSLEEIIAFEEEIEMDEIRDSEDLDQYIENFIYQIEEEEFLELLNEYL